MWCPFSQALRENTSYHCRPVGDAADRYRDISLRWMDVGQLLDRPEITKLASPGSLNTRSRYDSDEVSPRRANV